MRRPIALLNLLGVKTYWSCCGFEYDSKDNVDKKSHVIGMPQIWIDGGPRTHGLLYALLDNEIFGATREWAVHFLKLAYQKPMFQLFCNYNHSGFFVLKIIFL